MTDEEWVALAAKGDKIAEEYILKKYKPFAVSIANSYPAFEDMEDLVQEGMVGLYTAISTYNGKAGFSTYAYTCARNKILDAVKKRMGAKYSALNGFMPIAELGEGLYFSPLDTEDEVIKRENKREFYQKINKSLSTLEFKAIVMYIDGMGVAEIAAALDKDVKSAGNALNRAKSKLQKIFSAEG